MRKACLFCLLVFVFYSCNNKPSDNTVSKTDSPKDSVTSTHEPHHNTKPDVIISQPYSDEIQGIWGNMKYLESLRKYNSVGKVLEHIKFDTEIKINREMALIMRPQYMEPAELDTIKYILLAAGKDSLYVRSRNTGEKQLYVKLMSLPDTVLWNLYEEEKHSAISLLEWQWFQGKYNMINPKGEKSEVSFLSDGSISGMNFQFYSFGIDVDGKDFIYMERQYDEYAYFLIEYKSNNLYECYNIEYIEDWEYPFVKTSLAFKLQKIE